jgi:hypothetical protein
MQQQQNYKNHTRLVPLYHGVTLLAIVLLLIGSIINFTRSGSEGGNRYSASLIILVAVILGLLFFFIRSFALKAQDRAIRAEENFRHFILTQKPLDGRLRFSQIIALRFASDAEFPALAQKAVEEQMSAKQIKQAITNWRGDYHRV